MSMMIFLSILMVLVMSGLTVYVVYAAVSLAWKWNEQAKASVSEYVRLSNTDVAYPQWAEVDELAVKALRYNSVNTKSDYPLSDDDKAYFLRHDLLSNPELYRELSKAVSAREKQEQVERDRYDHEKKMRELKAKRLREHEELRDWGGSVVRDVY